MDGFTLFQMGSLTLGVIVVVLLVLVYFRGHRPQTISESAELLLEAERIAKVGVAAAQQLYETRNDVGSADRFELADEFLRDLTGLPSSKRRMFIEGAVFLLNESQKRGWLPAQPESATAGDMRLRLPRP